MLIVARSGREKQVVDVFRKWDLDAVVIGKVVEGNRLKVYHNGVLEADIPVDTVTDAAPRYERPMSPRVRPASDENPIPGRLQAASGDPGAALRKLLSSPNICSKRGVYEQYDTMVRTNTAILPGADAAVIRVKETRRAISMCLDGNGRYAAVDPRDGAKLIVAESARNNVCTGARPIAVTNCLNFASPERPEVMWSFSETVDGMSEACRAFETPVISGNVSFYNETDGKGILPTPTIGMVGLVEDVRKLVTRGFKNEGDVVALLGTTNDDLSVSEYAQTVAGLTTDALIAFGTLPKLDLELEKRVQAACLALADAQLISSAHDCSDGGLAVAVAESCFSSLNRDALGAVIDLSNIRNLSDAAMLFGESPSRIVISFSPDKLDAVRKTVGECPFEVIGRVAGDSLKISVAGREAVDVPVADLETAWASALGARLEG
jgi:phosphoribosylformylglycinamidine synthase